VRHKLMGALLTGEVVAVARKFINVMEELVLTSDRG